MSKYVTNWEEFPNFRKEEFRCKCGKCDGYGKGIAKSLVKTMQNLRTKYGKAINISSGYRCKSHNTKVGGSTTSKHMEGLACDFYFQDGSLGKEDFRIGIVNELKKTEYYRYSYCNIKGSHPNMGSAIHFDTKLVDIEDTKEEEKSKIEDDIKEKEEIKKEDNNQDLIKGENVSKFNVICTCLLTVINFFGRIFKKVFTFFVKD